MKTNRQMRISAILLAFLMLASLAGVATACTGGDGENTTEGTATAPTTATTAAQETVASEMTTCDETTEDETTDDATTAGEVTTPADETTAPETDDETSAPETTMDINQPLTGPYVTSSDLVLPVYDTSDREESVEYRFTGTGSTDFGLYSGGRAEGDVVILPHRTVSGVYPVAKSTEGAPTVYHFRLTCETAASESNWMTVYMGLRLSEARSDATGRCGVWIAMRNHSVGLRVGTWPATSFMTVDADFAAGELLTVVDDPINNIVTMYVGEEPVEIAHVVIDGRKLEMYAPGADAPAITDTLDEAVPSSGYAHIWGHHMDHDALVEELTITSTRTVGCGDTDGIRPGTRDLFADTWTATDDVGRTLTVGDGYVDGSKVGIFYFLWHESSKNAMPLIDHTAAYREGGMDGLWEAMQSGSLGFAHYWAEPYFGYYASDDEWVLRKHGAMLAEAGVDFIFFDATNGLLYPQNYTALLRVWSQMRTEGYKTPDVAFLCQGGNSGEFNSLWINLYDPGLYRDMWFYWNGKPLIMFTSRDTQLTGDVADFFTVKYSWANTSDEWYSKYRGVDCWSWGTMYPQRGGYRMEDGKRKLEQMVVMCGFWVNGSYGTNGGRSYTSKGKIPAPEGAWDLGYGLMNSTSGLGLGFQEQFDWAISKEPELIMVTGWNEWWAGRWQSNAAGQTIANDYTVVRDTSLKESNYFVDNLNPEYSRDIEPMKGGYGDNYYYQLVENIRKYKGARQVETAFGQWAIDLNGSVGQWYAVGPEYRDLTGDVFHRNHLSHVGGQTYTNDSGRNDIATAKVSSDDTYLYFYVACVDDITAPGDDATWMNLFLKTDGDETTGWYGFDYLLNRDRDGKSVSVERFVDGAWVFETVGRAEYVLSGRTLQIKVEKSLVGFADSFDFKWADHAVDDGDIMKFMDQGDTAPDNRYCYRFTTTAVEAEVLPECLTPDMIVLRAGSYNAYVGGHAVRLCADNTNATLLASGHDIWLPVDFLCDALGVEIGDAETYNHYGVTYVKATELVRSAGKVITTTSDGLVVISDAAVEDTHTTDILYRMLK